MYKVLCDNALMYDPRIEELALINPVVELEENKAGSFSFKMPPDHPLYSSVKRRKSVIQVYQDDDLIFSGMCIEVDTDFYKQKDVYCEGELAYLNDSVQRPKRYQRVSVRGLLEAYIANHNAQVEEEKRFTVGMVTVTDNNDYIYCYTNMNSTKQELKEDLVDDLGGYFRIRHKDGVKYIDYLADSMNTNSQVIWLGENLIDFKSNIDSSEIATAIIPLGNLLEEEVVEGLQTRLTIEEVNDGKDYVYSPEAVENFGWIYKTVTWDGVTVPSILKSKGQKYLSDIQFENMVIEAKAIDLHIVDHETERFKLSDQIRVVSKPHGLDRYFRLTKQTINICSPENDTITLGKEERLSLSAKTASANEEIKKAIEKITPASNILNQAVENATQLIANAMGGYVVKKNDELLIMDTNDTKTATKVWRWNINGLGYSSNGYNGPYSTALTMDGRFVASAITCEGLEVGKNVKMGANAKISWENVTGTSGVAEKSDIPTKTSDLENDSKYQTQTQVTEITKDTIKTSKFSCDQLEGGTIAAKLLTALVIQTVWNDITDYVKLEDGSINIYNTEKEKIMTINRSGIAFVHGGIEALNMSLSGETGAGTSGPRGLDFFVNFVADYIGWTATPDANQEHKPKWVYERTGGSDFGYDQDTLNAGCDIDCHGNAIKNVAVSGEVKVKKDVEFSFEEGTTIDTKGATLTNVKIDGGFSGFINPQSGNTIVVQNGIIVSG
nr:MAG TPA: tail protein [Caudoviricetes sp.]